MKILQFILILLLNIYVSGCIVIILSIVFGKMTFRFTDNKEHTKWQYIKGLVFIILFWPFCIVITKKED